MQYRAIVSSDWSECLAPSGPFDPMSFNYPELEPELSAIFRDYTGNRISLGQATARIAELLPRPLSTEQMDAYLDASFSTYTRVPELIQWCLSKGILFMINTTAPQGYFQRVFDKGLLPRLPVVSANPMIRFTGPDDDHPQFLDIREIEDKPKNTQAVIRRWSIAADKVVLMGDSGGDGPHFRWGASAGAFLIGSMTKNSLETYCSAADITIHKRFGISYAAGRQRDPAKETEVDFMELSTFVAAALDL